MLLNHLLQCVSCSDCLQGVWSWFSFHVWWLNTRKMLPVLLQNLRRWKWIWRRIGTTALSLHTCVRRRRRTTRLSWSIVKRNVSNAWQKIGIKNAPPKCASHAVQSTELLSALHTRRSRCKHRSRCKDRNERLFYSLVIALLSHLLVDTRGGGSKNLG